MTKTNVMRLLDAAKIAYEALRSMNMMKRTFRDCMRRSRLAWMRSRCLKHW